MDSIHNFGFLRVFAMALIINQLFDSLFLSVWATGLPDFSWYKIPKQGKYTK
jgi:hypothetical protein